MGLSPKEMGEAVARNLKKKTGKSLAEWLSIALASGYTDKKELMAFLKKEKGLGHFQAQRIYEEIKGIDPYKDDKTFEAKIFSAKKDFENYQILKDKILKIGKGVSVKPCKTYIPFYHNKQFALLTMTKQGILLGLNLPDNYQNDEVVSSCRIGSARINAHVNINTPKDWNKKVRAAVKEAYKNN